MSTPEEVLGMLDEPEFRFDCGDCGQNIDGRELHTYVHCVLHKAGIDPADYGLVLLKVSDEPCDDLCKAWHGTKAGSPS